MIGTARRVSVAALLTGGILGASLGLAPAASADERPIEPSKSDCGWAQVTCTKYWSVDRTKKLNNEWKYAVIGGYGVAMAAVGATAAGVSALPYGAVVAVPAGFAAESGLVYKIAEFDVQVSQAAADGRCLIYKYPKGQLQLGWWGSVSLSNGHCDQSH